MSKNEEGLDEMPPCTLRAALLDAPKQSNMAVASDLLAMMYAKCMSISRRQMTHSTAVVAGSRGRDKIWSSLGYRNVARRSRRGEVCVLAGIAFQRHRQLLM
jgi:hypothetical protein